MSHSNRYYRSVHRFSTSYLYSVPYNPASCSASLREDADIIVKYKATGEMPAFHVAFQFFSRQSTSLPLPSCDLMKAAGTEMERNSTTAKFGIQERKRDHVNQN
jgi:hypothetical protein